MVPRLIRRRRSKIQLCIGISFLAFITLLLLAYMLSFFDSKTHSRTALVVLGNTNQTTNKVRAEMAAEYAVEMLNDRDLIILSGGRCKGGIDDPTEAAMLEASFRRHLLDMGTSTTPPDMNIILEDQSRHTIDNALLSLTAVHTFFSRQVLDDTQLELISVNVVIITSPDHCERALALFHHALGHHHSSHLTRGSVECVAARQPFLDDDDIVNLPKPTEPSSVTVRHSQQMEDLFFAQDRTWTSTKQNVITDLDAGCEASTAGICQFHGDCGLDDSWK